ncbi:LysR substrate-binding domain-containing protein [Paracidovorax anthurii]|uniref:LysR family glycine cleavage system transcriptional activator n=1 Tax=Paracidovorax anthurii TaxID=78229 RepID=A0A328ZHU8_9BURK|nr:LysR substrate-binding domain-containing protein [Paracidovorax anthurii]RAR85154.1 LysR family glycine cleavage system transcriptional activator [Paracidovorax anthurii]
MRLPPLTAVRFFEAAARHLSVRGAAQELHVTPGAVSQQLRKLEEFLGCALFERLPRGLALTAAGQDYRAACGEALALIGHATARLSVQGRRAVLVSCTPGFAVQWLVPRLQDFHRLAPDTDVHVSTTDRLVDLAAEGVHFAVRHGLGAYPGLRSEVLVADDLVPVCSPRLIAPRRVARRADITSDRLLHDEHRGDWRLWCAAQGMAGLDCEQGVVFSRSNGAIEAALAGRGFALARRAFVARELATRALVGVQAAPLATALAYRLVYRPEALVDPALRTFHGWITAQAACAARA